MNNTINEYVECHGRVKGKWQQRKSEENSMLSVKRLAGSTS